MCFFLFVLFWFFNKFIYLFYFWLHQVFVAAHGLSLVAASRGLSSLWCAGSSLKWLLLLRSTGSRCAGFSSCGTWAQQLWLTGSRAQAQQLQRTGLVAPRHVGSSQTRARTRVPCIDRQILNHCINREVSLRVVFGGIFVFPLLPFYCIFFLVPFRKYVYILGLYHPYIYCKLFKVTSCIFTLFVVYFEEQKSS